MLNKTRIIALVLIFSVAACTSKKVDKETGDLADLSEDAFVMEGDEDPFAVDESLEGGNDLVADLGSDSDNMDDFSFDDMDSSAGTPKSEDTAAAGSADANTADEGFGDFDDFDDTGGPDPFADSTSDADAASTGDVAGTSNDSSIASPADDLFAEPSQDNFLAGDLSSTETEPEVNDSFQSPVAASEEFEAERSWVPVKKIAEAPFRKSGILINAVYLARDGDTTKSVSEKIFGSSSREEDLLTLNPHFRGKGLKVGDKVYYNSPSRPADEQSLLTYYEDIGLSPEFYMTQSGDNIRQVSSQLLGHPDSWKEVWATNLGVDSKGELDPGLQLKYWSNVPTGSVPVRQAALPPPPPPAQADPFDSSGSEDMGEMNAPTGNLARNDQGSNGFEVPSEPPPLPPSGAQDPAQEFGQSDFAMPEEPPPAGAVGSIEPPPPPPPPVAPPAPPAERSAARASVDDSEQTLMMGVGALLLLGALAVFIIRKKRAQKQLDFNTATQTQIE